MGDYFTGRSTQMCPLTIIIWIVFINTVSQWNIMIRSVSIVVVDCTFTMTFDVHRKLVG